MKRWLLILIAAAALFGMPKSSLAYFSIDFGAMDNDHFGYGVGFGLYTPANFGFEAKILSYYDSAGVISDNYWMQTGLNVFYDFNKLMPEGNLQPLHPKLIFGFSYASIFESNIDISGTQYGIRASNGPGLNFGVGCDWQLDKKLAIGLDLFESVHWFDGSSISGTVISQDETNYGFNALVSMKIFD